MTRMIGEKRTLNFIFFYRMMTGLEKLAEALEQL